MTEPDYFGGIFERHVVPAGFELFYRDEPDKPKHPFNHTYWRAVQLVNDEWKGQGRLSPSVSAAAKVLDTGGSDGLIKWGCEYNNIGVSILANDCLDFRDEWTSSGSALDWLRSGPAIDAALKEAKLTWKDVRGQAADRGTAVHREALEALARGEEFPSFENLTAEQQGFARGVKTFWDEHEPEPIHSECVVADLDLGVAGRFDLIYRSRLGALTLLDLKTTKTLPRKMDHPFYRPTDAAQVNGYRYLATVSGYPTVQALAVLYIDQSGDWELVPMPVDASDFLAAVDIHRRAKRIKADIRAALKGELVAAQVPRQGDLFTSTVEGAEAYERLHGGHR